MSKCSSTEYWKFEGSLDGLEFSINEGNKISLRYGRVLVTTIIAMYGLTLGTYDGSEIGS